MNSWNSSCGKNLEYPIALNMAAANQTQGGDAIHGQSGRFGGSIVMVPLPFFGRFFWHWALINARHVLIKPGFYFFRLKQKKHFSIWRGTKISVLRHHGFGAGHHNHGAPTIVRDLFASAFLYKKKNNLFREKEQVFLIIPNWLVSVLIWKSKNGNLTFLIILIAFISFT